MMDAVCKFSGSIWQLLLSCNVFYGESFDDGTGKICLRVGRKCWDDVMTSFFKEATSFFNHFLFF